MKKYLSAAIVFLVMPNLFAQSVTTGALPSDPNALLAMAAPYYDYSSADMKPWHIRYHYEYYDLNGTTSAKGEFDYWWSAAKGSRISWTEGDRTHIEWHTPDGKELRSVTGNEIPNLEHRLISALLPEFAKIKDLIGPDDRQLEYFTTQYSSHHVVCVGSVRTAAADRKIKSINDVWPAYCFDEHAPVLIASHENGTFTTSYSKAQTFQSHNFPGEIQISYVGKKRVEATLEDLSEVQADDAAFMPSADASEYVRRVTRTVVPLTQMTPLVLIRRVDPIYPLSAHAANIGGTVVVEATIGKDGRIKDARVVSSPDASLSAAALDAVVQWRYKPIIVAGQPMEIHTRISVGFAP